MSRDDTGLFLSRKSLLDPEVSTVDEVHRLGDMWYNLRMKRLLNAGENEDLSNLWLEAFSKIPSLRRLNFDKFRQRLKNEVDDESAQPKLGKFAVEKSIPPPFPLRVI